MNNLLYLIALILILGWLIGVVVFNMSGFIHLFLGFAIIAVLFRIIGGEKLV